MDSFELPDIKAFSLQITIHIKPEDTDSFFEACQPIFKAVTAESDCLYFEIFQDPASPGTISWVENWDKSPDWFMKNQMTKGYYKPYLEATEKLYIRPREVKFLKRLGSDYVYSKPKNFA